jgi:hypothetical protein
MKLFSAVLALCFATAMMGTANADSTLDLNLNDHSARLDYMTSLTPTGLYINGAYLYNSDRGDVANVGIHLIGDAGVGPNPLRAGLGGQLFYVNPDPGRPCGNECLIVGARPGHHLPHGNGIPHDASSGEALGIGGFVKYQFTSFNRVGVGAHIYYAPDIIAFGGLDRYFEYGVRADYQVLRNANVYIGFRQIRADFGSGYADMDSGFHVGMQLNF